MQLRFSSGTFKGLQVAIYKVAEAVLIWDIANGTCRVERLNPRPKDFTLSQTLALTDCPHPDTQASSLFIYRNFHQKLSLTADSCRVGNLYINFNARLCLYASLMFKFWNIQSLERSSSVLFTDGIKVTTREGEVSDLDLSLCQQYNVFSDFFNEISGLVVKFNLIFEYGSHLTKLNSAINL